MRPEVVSMSASLHRAPSATVSFHSAKISAQKNHTVEKLDAREDCAAIVAKPCRIGTQGLRRACRKQRELLHELPKRQTLKLQARDKKEKGRLEAKMRKVQKKTSTCMEEFPQLSEEEAKVIVDFLCGSDWLPCWCQCWTHLDQ